MGRKTENMIMDNLGLVAWLVENRLQKSMRTLNLSKDGTLKFYMEDGPELSVSQEIVAKQIKPLIDLVGEVYGTKYLEFEKDKVIFKKDPEKIISKKDFEREMRHALTTKAEYLSILNNIHCIGVEKLYGRPILDILTVYNNLNDCIRNYCHDGRPTIPIQFEIDMNSQGNLLSSVYELKRTF